MGSECAHVTRVLFCGPEFPCFQLYTSEYLNKYPYNIEVDEVPRQEVPNVIGHYDVCVVKMMKIDSNLISRAMQMKLIIQFGVGLEGVDVDAATKHGIKVARIPGDNSGNAASCAEMAMYLMLGLLRKQKEMEMSLRMMKLGAPCGGTLFGKTVFIMGLGNIGRELAKRLKAFDVKVLATNRRCNSLQINGFPSQNEWVDEKGSHDDIYKFAAKADIVACCLNMNSETAGVVNHKFINSMKKGAYLVNVARGGLLDYEAIVYGLKSGHLGGLGMDVAWTEPFDPNDPIAQLPNVLITPHVAGVTEYSCRSMAKYCERIVTNFQLRVNMDLLAKLLEANTSLHNPHLDRIPIDDGNGMVVVEVVPNLPEHIVLGDVVLRLHEGNTMTGIEIIN